MNVDLIKLSVHFQSHNKLMEQVDKLKSMISLLQGGGGGREEKGGGGGGR